MDLGCDWNAWGLSRYLWEVIISGWLTQAVKALILFSPHPLFSI